jgi:hypothetical protein
MEETNEQDTLEAYTAEQALEIIDKKQEAYDQKFINKELDENPREYIATGVIQFGSHIFKKKDKDGTMIDDKRDIWHFEIANDREFTTSNFTTAREIISALKDKKYKLTLAHRSQKGKDGQFHDAIVLVKAE